MTRQECADFLRSHDNYLLLTHLRPDGDTLGSAVALCHFLRRMGKQAWVYPNADTSAFYLDMVTPFYPDEGQSFDTVVAVDISARNRIAAGYEGKVDLSIDHHPESGDFCTYACTDSSKAAGGELMLEVLELLGDIDPFEADCLYTAVSTDSGCFRFSNTTADTFRAAARLTEAGANIAELNKKLFRSKSRARMLLEGMICSSLLSYKDAQLNIAVVTLEMMEKSGAREEDCMDMADLAGMVSTNKVAITVRELRPNHCKISIRTDGSISSITIAKAFGGGGHLMASGCEIPLEPFAAADAIRKVTEELWP